MKLRRCAPPIGPTRKNKVRRSASFSRSEVRRTVARGSEEREPRDPCYLRDGSQEILQHASLETGVGEHVHDFCCRVFEYEIESPRVMEFTLSGEKVEKSA